MQRDARAHLADMRAFTIIGMAVAVAAHEALDVFVSITQARRIVDFRNQLTRWKRSAGRAC
jgi:hypothetical protein